MAQNLSNFAQRAITGTVFVAVVLASLIDPVYLRTLCLVVSVMCASEFYQMFKCDARTTPIWMLLGVLALYISTQAYSTFESENNKLWQLGILGIFILGLTIAFEYKVLLNSILYRLLGLIYTTLPLMLLYALAYPAHDTLMRIFYIDITSSCITFNSTYIFMMLLLTWSNDTFAYLIGRKIGKTPFAPIISPKKTWEGTIAGFVCTLLMAALLSWLFFNTIELKYILWGGVVSIAATLGDLLESKMKRTTGIKDSGDLLPGHGGFLDRFDAMLLTAPLSWLFFVVWGV
jgi:phosphatidate cytidylyltransferase